MVVWKLSSRLFSRPDWLPLGLRGWVMTCIVISMEFHEGCRGRVLRTCLPLASHAGVFRGARVSSLPTNACSTANNIPFPLSYSCGTWPINSCEKSVDSLNKTHKLVVVWKRDARVTFFLYFFPSLTLCNVRSILNRTFAALILTFIRGHKAFLVFRTDQVIVGLPGGQGQLFRIWKVQCDWLSLGMECCSRLSRRLWGGTKHKLP